jgi:hypothetical protein
MLAGVLSPTQLPASLLECHTGSKLRIVARVFSQPGRGTAWMQQERAIGYDFP